VGHITLLQQIPEVLNWGCQVTHVVLYNGRKMVVVLVVAGSMHISTALAVAGIGRVYKEHISKVRGRVFN